jgi:hypothetical protein
MPTLEAALELALTLSREEQRTLEEILRQRRIQERREEIAINGHEAIRAFHAGELKAQTVEEILDELYEGISDDVEEKEFEEAQVQE